MQQLSFAAPSSAAKVPLGQQLSEVHKTSQSTSHAGCPAPVTRHQKAPDAFLLGSISRDRMQAQTHKSISVRGWVCDRKAEAVLMPQATAPDKGMPSFNYVVLVKIGSYCGKRKTANGTNVCQSERSSTAK
eukprot:6481787-Amphidinium_carterae.1